MPETIENSLIRSEEISLTTKNSRLLCISVSAVESWAEVSEGLRVSEKAFLRHALRHGF